MGTNQLGNFDKALALLKSLDQMMNAAKDPGEIVRTPRTNCWSFSMFNESEPCLSVQSVWSLCSRPWRIGHHRTVDVSHFCPNWNSLRSTRALPNTRYWPLGRGSNADHVRLGFVSFKRAITVLKEANLEKFAQFAQQFQRPGTSLTMSLIN